ncbi:MAG: hypothetical protein GY719_11215 [bacterium]|nr:hypothetical protein [bacterium]
MKNTAVLLVLILPLISMPAAGSGSRPPVQQPEATPQEPSSELPESQREDADGAGSSGLERFPEPWRSRFGQIDADLRGGRWQAAASAAGQLAERMARLFPASPAGRGMVAMALTMQAVAESESGRREEALWHWQIAQNLNPGLRQAPLVEVFGEAGAWLEARPLRAAGILDSPLPPAGAETTQPAPLSVPPPEPPRELRDAWSSEVLEIEVVVDAGGEIRSPVVLRGGELPGKVYFSLVALERWRFRPALACGEPTAVLLRLDGLARRTLPFVAARSRKLGPIHELLLEQRWHEARTESQLLIDEAVECLATRSRQDCDPGRPLVLRAVAEAGLGRTEDALWSWHLAYSFLSIPVAGGLEVYGSQPGRLLADQPCAVVPEVCGAVPLRDALEIAPPKAIVAPPLRLPAGLAGRVGADRLIASLWVDAGGRVRGAVMHAGHSGAAGYEALMAVHDWRFEPARRSDEPVAVAYEVSIPLESTAPAERIARWRRGMDDLREQLAAGDWQGAYEGARPLVTEIAGAIGDGGSDLLARSLAQLALAEAGLGLADEAIWHWHTAQNLAVEYRVSNLSAYGEAGDLLARHRLRRPGEAPAEPDDSDRGEPREIAGPMPRYPGEITETVDVTSDPDIAIIELIIDESGSTRAPVVLAGRSSARLFTVLEALREWRFEPALRSGAPVPVLRRLTLLLESTIRLPDISLAPDAERLVRLAVKKARRQPRLAGCYWRAARSLEPALARVDPGSLGPAAAPLVESVAPPRDRWSLDASPGGVSAGTGPLSLAAGGKVEIPRRIHAPNPQYTPGARKARIRGVAIAQAVIGGRGSGTRLNVGGEVELPRKVHAPNPRYKAKIEGVVIVRAVIDERGYVTGLELLEGLPEGLNVEAAKDLCRWRFEPATLEGKPVAVYHDLTVDFRFQ